MHPDRLPVTNAADCPLKAKHTPAPTGYLAWHEWAEKKTRTHVQVKCRGCGRLEIWKRKKAAPNGMLTVSMG